MSTDQRYPPFLYKHLEGKGVPVIPWEREIVKRR